MAEREYRCENCRHEFRRVVFAGDPDETRCPECHSRKIHTAIGYPRLLNEKTPIGATMDLRSGFE